jgi:ABC-type sulfate/molybdate transport systems ATPase subunit
VILVSSELPELMGVADRIVVMYKGRIVQVVPRAEFDAGHIVAAAAGLGASTSSHARGASRHAKPAAPA